MYKCLFLIGLVGFLFFSTPVQAVRFTASGDYNATANTNAVLSSIANSGSEFTLALGDLSYGVIKPESAWCNYVKSYLGSNYPFEIVAGNHDSIYEGDADILTFVNCLPHRVGSLSGSYGTKYYFDYSNLVRFIMISPNINLSGTKSTYWIGTPEYEWVSQAIDSARAANIPWIVVGLHYNCLSVAQYSCNYTTDLVNLFASKKVDLVLNGHDHSYQRSHQLALGANCSRINSGTFNQGCVAASGASGSYTKGFGTIFMTVGAGGDELYEINLADSELPYFATYMGLNLNPRFGYLQVDLSANSFIGKFIGSTNTSSYSDVFSINPPSSTTPTPTPTPTSIPVPTTGFIGNYYPNRNLSGVASLTRTDPEVNFDWDEASPAPNFPANDFSVRWTANPIFKAGNYRFSVTADDGVRLILDGSTVINKWVDQGPTTYTFDLYLSEGVHSIVMDYYEHLVGAVAKLSWNQIAPSSTPTLMPTPTPTPAPSPTPIAIPSPTLVPSNSYQGEYFIGKNLTAPAAVTRIDPVVDFDWDEAAPMANFPDNDFSVRWTTNRYFSTGLYRFSVRADDGVRLYIDGVKVIDKWVDQGPTTYTYDINLTGGNHSIVMEYYEHFVGAVAKLSWQSMESPTPTPISTPTILPTPLPTPTVLPGTDFQAEFFLNKNLSGTPVFVRTDPVLNFDWGYDWPDLRLGTNENYSIRWTGNLLVPTPATYRFTLTTDDGSRLKIDGSTVIDNWSDHGPTPVSADTHLSPGLHQIVVEYFQGLVTANASLSWIVQ